MNTLRFIGSCEKLPETANLGDLCVVNGQDYVYIDTWYETGMNCAQEIEKADIVHIENQTLIIDF